MSGDESVPPQMMIILRALKVRDCCCLGGLVSIQLIRGFSCTYGWVERLGGNSADTDGFAVFHDDFVDFGVTLEVQVGVHCSG